MSKIKLGDTHISAMGKMSDGNPGAISALMSMYQDSSRVDPKGSVIGPLSHIMLLDTFGIYGADVYVLWSDKCGKDVYKLIVLIRATQLGFIPVQDLKAMAADHRYKIMPSEEQFKKYEAQVNRFLGEEGALVKI